MDGSREESGWAPVLPPLSRASLALAALFGLLMCATQGGYDLAGDEYFFLAAGGHLSWGYADQPPLVAALARLADTLAPDSRAVLRLPMVLAVCAGIVMCALIAREFGGRRAPQLLGATTFALTPYALSHSRYVTTDAIDLAIWASATWLLARWIRTRRDRLWWAMGALTAVALQGKYLIVAFWAVTAAAVALVGPRDLLRRPAVWAAALLAGLSAVPSLLWQAQHGWPQLEEGPAITSDVAALGGRAMFLPGLAAALGIVGTVLWCWGSWWLLRRGGPHRCLGWVIVALVLLAWVAQLRRNYLGGLFPLGIAVGAVQLERVAHRWRPLAWASLAASAIVLLPVLVPVGNGWLGGVDRYLFPNHRNDWQGLAAAVAAVVDEVPPADRAVTVVIAGDYWRSSVLDRLRRRYALPPVYGDMQGSWFLAAPGAATRTVVYVDLPPQVLRQQCARLVLRRWFVDTRVSALSQEPTRTPIYICQGLDTPITRLWPQMRHTTLPG